MCQAIIIILWYIDQIHAIPKYIKKEIERIYDILWNEKKQGLPGTYLISLHVVCWKWCVRHRSSIKLSKNL